MTKHVLIFLFAFMANGILPAQNFCKKTSLFFEKDEALLTAQAKKKLDSLIYKIGKSEFMIEMYGHSDTTASKDYNLKLSGERMSAVKKYVNSKTKGKVQYKEKNLGETNNLIKKSKEEILAYNRRVDLFLTPMQGGKLILKGPKNETIELPASSFESCGFCNSQPAVKSYYSAEDGKKDNITFQSTDGANLITGGTIKLDYITCKGWKKDTSTLKISIPASQLDPSMTVWEAEMKNGKIYWKPSEKKLQLDAKTNTYVIRGKPGEYYNVDKKPDPPFQYNSKIIFPKKLSDKHNLLTDNTKKRQDLPMFDTVLIDNKDTVMLVRGIGKLGNDYYYLSVPVDSLPCTSKKNGFVISKTYKACFEMYNQFTFNDTISKARFKKQPRIKQFGFYLPEYNEFIPVERTSGKYFSGNTIDAKYQYAFVRDGKVYAVENKKVKKKYSSKTKTNKIIFKKKSMKNFKMVKVLKN